MSLGHKLEVQFHKHNGRRPGFPVPPKVPKHPLLDVDWNMNEITTYRDLKLRWRVFNKQANE